MHSTGIAAFVILSLALVLLMPVAAAGEPVSDHLYADSTIWLEPPYAVEAVQGQYTNTAHPQDGGLFELPLIGRLAGVGIRSSWARNHFNGLSQQGIFLDFNTPWSWSTWGGTQTSLRLSFEAGRIQKASQKRFYLSLGPNLRIVKERWRVPLFLDVGLSPTVIDGSTFGDEDLGTSLNFTSYLGLGIKLGHTRRQEIRLRYQHISNGGIDDVNPGVDMIGLDFVFWGRQN